MDRQQYYQQPMVLYNIIPQLKNRYLSIRKVSKDGKGILSRYYQGYSIPTLQDSLKRHNAYKDQSAKLYFDLSTWKDEEGYTPIFSFNQEKREEQKKKFSGDRLRGGGEYEKLMNSHDFAIDIDSKNVNTAWKEAKKVKEMFDEYKLPYSLKFSGSKGFHFHIDSNYTMLENYKIIEHPRAFGIAVNNLIDDENLKCIDTSIYDPRRILKIAYSLNYKDGKEYVCLPLTDEQFEKWKLENMELDNVLYGENRVKLFKRGMCVRNHGLDEKQLKENFDKFIEDFTK